MSDARPSELSASVRGAATAVARQAEKPVSAAIDSREARIAQLREQYRSGTYEVNGSTVGAKIIEDQLRK